MGGGRRRDGGSEQRDGEARPSCAIPSITRRSSSNLTTGVEVVERTAQQLEVGVPVRVGARRPCRLHRRQLAVQGGVGGRAAPGCPRHVGSNARERLEGRRGVQPEGTIACRQLREAGVLGLTMRPARSANGRFDCVPPINQRTLVWGG